MKPSSWGGVGLGSDGIFRVDSSALGAWMTCSFKAWCRYAMGLTTKGEKAALLAGKAAHNAMECYFKTESIKDSLIEFGLIYEPWAKQNVAGDDRLAYQNVADIMECWFKAHTPKGGGSFTNLPWRVVSEYVEVPFEVPLAEGINLIGRLDMLPLYSSGYAVVEHKTTGSINQWWQAQWKLSAQLTAYLFAARQVMDKPVLGVFLNAIEFSKLPGDPSRSCKTHKMKYSECRLLHAKWEMLGLYERPEKLISGWRLDAIEAAKRMRQVFEQAATIEDACALAQEGMFNGGCRGCEFSEGVCDMGRQPHLIEQNLVEEWWNPLEV